MGGGGEGADTYINTCKKKKEHQMNVTCVGTKEPVS